MSIVQQSIAKTRHLLFERKRQIAVAIKHARQSEQKRNAALELLIDGVCAETGLKFTQENMPTIALFVKQVIKDQRKGPEDDDPEGMSDFPL
jgi:hypothetical protein